MRPQRVVITTDTEDAKRDVIRWLVNRALWVDVEAAYACVRWAHEIDTKLTNKELARQRRNLNR